MSVQIIDMPDDSALQQQVAQTCVEYWQRDFPLDTDEWYLNLYAESLSSEGLPIVLVALENDAFVGTASLIADDELPNAAEPGPWVAAVFVAPSHRHQGVGSSLVMELQERAAMVGIEEIFLYTETGAPWYESLGWTSLRQAHLSGHEVTVMSRRVAPR